MKFLFLINLLIQLTQGVGIAGEHEHCWHPSKYQHAAINHRDRICCHCGEKECVYYNPGEVHGSYYPAVLTHKNTKYIPPDYSDSEGNVLI